MRSPHEQKVRDVSLWVSDVLRAAMASGGESVKHRVPAPVNRHVINRAKNREPLKDLDGMSVPRRRYFCDIEFGSQRERMSAAHCDCSTIGSGQSIHAEEVPGGSVLLPFQNWFQVNFPRARI